MSGETEEKEPQRKDIFVFVGSPSDVAAERNKAFEIIESVASEPSFRDRCRVNAIGWDRNHYQRDARVTPQKAIDLGLRKPGDCHVALFIFSQRIGTELPPADYPESYGFKSLTGSLWEFYNACQGAEVNGWPSVLCFYADNRLPENPLDETRTEKEVLQQRLGVIEFVDREFLDEYQRHTGDLLEYDSLGAFADLFAQQLREHLHKCLEPLVENTGWRKRYLAWVKREEVAGAVSLPGLDLKKRTRVSLPRVYVPALTSAIQHRAGNAADEDWGTAPEFDTTRYEPILHRLGRESLYLAGAPGSGKSFFCRWLRWLVANGAVPQQRIADPEEFRETLPGSLLDLVPVLITLREFGAILEAHAGTGSWEAHQLTTALAHWLDESRPGGLDGDGFKCLLREGKALLILDGVDEVVEIIQPDGARRCPRQCFITGLANALLEWLPAGNRILLTSRPYGLSTSQWQSLNLPEAQLLELPAALQPVFVQRWFHEVDPQDWQTSSEDFWREVSGQSGQNPVLEAWLANPLLLTALCAKYDDGHRLPRDTHDLYNSIIDRALYNRFEEQVTGELYRRRLAVIALGMHRGCHNAPQRSSPEAAVSTREIDAILADYKDKNKHSEAVDFEVVRSRHELLSHSGLLLPTGPAKAQFLHLSFQEFLAAERIDQLRECVPSLLANTAGKPAWRATLKFLFARLLNSSPDNAVGDFINLQKHLDVAELATNPNPAKLWGDCLELLQAKRIMNPELGSQFLKACEAALEGVADAEVRETLFCQLERIGWDRRAGVGLKDNGLPDIDWLPVPADGQTAFYISRYPITNRQYRAFIDAGGYEDWDRWLAIQGVDQPNFEPSFWQESNHPRTDCSWYEALAYCRWLGAQPGITPTEGWRIDLPTAAEWQRAYVGDSELDYPWHANEYRLDHANIDESGHGGRWLQRTTAVGLYPRGASACGALDMGGNVWEWCLSKHDHPGNNGVDDSEEPRVLRGGSWLNNPGNLRSALRVNYDPDFRYYNIGFRVVCRPHWGFDL